jgi:hypothetical protein
MRMRQKKGIRMTKEKDVPVKPYKRSPPSNPPKKSPKPGPKNVPVDGHKRSRPRKKK